MKKCYGVAYFVIVLSLLVQFQSCKDSITGYSLMDLRTVSPLQVGNDWTYLDITPSDVVTFPDDSTIVTTTVVSYFDSADARFYKLAGLIGESDANYFETVTSTRYQRYVVGSDKHLVPYATILKTPVRNGTRWNINDNDSTLGYAEIVNADTSIETLFGKMKGVIYVRSSDNNQWFILPGTGIVYETRMSIGGMIRRQMVGKNF